MSGVVRAVVMWLIALAIPLQGMAAVAVPPCPPAHHAAMPRAAEGLAGHHGSAPRMAAAAVHAMHQDAAAQHAADPGHGGGTVHGAADDSGHGMLKCCSAACSMAAAEAPELAVRVHARSPAPRHPVALSYRGVTPDGLDRPPKAALA